MKYEKQTKNIWNNQLREIFPWKKNINNYYVIMIRCFMVDYNVSEKKRKSFLLQKNENE